MIVGSIPSVLLAGALLVIGFCVGVAGSFFGVGGAFMVTPALNILGFPMTYAIGTDLAHMTGKSVVATIRHRRLGNVDWKAGGLLLIGTLPGVKLGASVVMRLEQSGSTESVLRSVYIILLLVVGGLIVFDYTRKRGKATAIRGKAFFQRHLSIPPLISLKTSGIESISVWSVIGLGFVTGFTASFLGVGGGFIRMPAMLYLLGMPTKVAVGTDLLEVLFSGGYGTFLYAREGKVDVIAALIMLLGASVGSHLGASATQFVEPRKIRLYLGLAILGTAAAVAAKQIGLSVLSAGLLLLLGPTLAGLILYRLHRGLKFQRKLILNQEKAEARR